MKPKTRATLIFIRVEENAQCDLCFRHIDGFQPDRFDPELIWAQVKVPASRNMIIHVYIRSYALFMQQLSRLSGLMKQESFVLADHAYGTVESLLTVESIASGKVMMKE